MLHRRVRLLLDRDYRVRTGDIAPLEAGRGVHGICWRRLLLSTITLRPSAATAQEMKAQPGATNAIARAASQKAAITGDRFEYAGRVLDPDGKPVAGAKLHLAYFGYNGQAPPAIRATSDASGPIPDRRAQGRLRRHDV